MQIEKKIDFYFHSENVKEDLESTSKHLPIFQKMKAFQKTRAIHKQHIIISH